jgi:predicted GNAT family N-acyltransferase
MNLKWKFVSFVSQALLNLKFPEVKFREIKDEKEAEKMQKLVWEVYGVEYGYFDTTQILPENLNDEYDEVSIKIGAFNKNMLIGCCRLILPSQKGFYAEKDFNIDLSLFPREKIGEISQFVVHKTYRGELISFGIWKKALETSRMKNLEWWIIVTSEKIKNYLLKGYGIKCERVNIRELTQKHIKTREKMIYYYQKMKPMPYIISLKDLY